MTPLLGTAITVVQLLLIGSLFTPPVHGFTALFPSFGNQRTLNLLKPPSDAVNGVSPTSPSTVSPTATTTTSLGALPRRRGILGGLLGGAFAAGGGTKEQKVASAAAAPPSTSSLVADLPMERIQLPPAGLGRDYVAIPLKIKGQGPFTFMLDTGLTTEMITPHLQQSLGIGIDAKRSIAGLAAGGATSNALVDLTDASLCCGTIDGGNRDEMPLPPLHAVITDFPQEHIDPKHDPVEGMLGMEVLSLFDVEFDFPKGRVRFWKPGTADTKGLTEIPAVVINETGLIGIRVNVPGGKQPILGFLDCGATFSCMNWKAAVQLGLPADKKDPIYSKGPAVQAIGIDGQPLVLPTVQQALTFAGEVQTDPSTGRPVGFSPPPSGWKDWSPVQVGIGDISAFSTILGDGVRPYDGPAALIGLDILAQRKVILQAGTDRTRRRRVFVSPK